MLEISKMACDMDMVSTLNFSLILILMIGNINHTKKGEKYEGNWENDKKHGKGKITYANGDSFKG